MTITPTAEALLPGRVVEVRGAMWAVTDVHQQGLSRSPADETVAGLQHVVTLQALGEDNLGDELRVIWELEVGNTLAPDQGLPARISPDAFDDPNKLGAFVDAARWGAVTSADDDAYQSPFRSGANVEAYQLEPLRRALQAPRANLLLADDVGLGKTIEAGLVIQELLLRHRARSVVVVCPPSLSLKWQDEMRDKFGLDFAVVNSDRMAELRRSHGLNANPFRLFPRVIVSMAWLRSARAQRLLREIYADVDDSHSARRFAFDVLVVDEAHHVAPSAPARIGQSSRGYAVDSQRTIHTRELAERCEHRLFLSATPHNGHSESFTALLEMIDNRRFSRGADLDEHALREITVRRLKSEITSKNFPTRSIRQLPFTPADDEQAHFQLLADLLSASRQKNGPGQGDDLVGMLLKKRFLSSPVAFGRTLAAYAETLAHPGRTLAASLFDDDEVLREVLGSEASDEEEGLRDHPEFTALSMRAATNPLSAATAADIDRLVDWGLSYAARPDSRLAALISFLDGVVRIGRDWSNERVVVFTEYADTLDWIVEVLRSKGYGDRLAVIQGATDADERELIRQRFTVDPADDPLRVLVATDSAGEGIDLQNHCHRLVNFDVPFNPSRLEQRIGRIDRYGQTATPEVFHFVPDESSTTFGADMDFMALIARKVGQVAHDLGSVNQVIDLDIQQHFSPDKNRSTVVDQRAATIINKTLAGGLELNRRLDELSRSFDAKKRDLHLTPEATRRVVETALTFARQPALVEIGDDRTNAPVFRVPPLGPRWQQSLAGLATKLDPGRQRPITFDPDALIDPDDGTTRADLVAIHLGHPLLQRSARLLRNGLVTVGADVNRVTAVVMDGLDSSCVAAVSRLVLVGRGGLRLHEEVFVTGLRMRAQDLAEEKVQILLDRALDPGRHTPATAAVRAHLADLWNGDGDAQSRLHERLTGAMQRRAETRQRRVEDLLDSRRDADLTRATEIFTAFRRNLTDSIARLRREEDEQQDMLPLADDQRAQRTRDLRVMEARLDSLADEERRELGLIRDRYTDVHPYVSAVALVFALTPADAAAWGQAR
ncbi:Superfamily II DNA/RNA helicases, SNF2 family [Tessaracoccus bendigoensis DSM 12906]|uniref:Superfamily II DNA/RNA helicases, SNF2 family n=1 Tax=Tessaracoccus bendigoensis DSM 12906 TaxID=1123357 RepID=A0A1M6JA85_9ACTN|nr:DISARM system SNF2-like helicase DrmD [Tessaracoccus bendigoensis]SHJ43544.1 Superfamily II DNA/RNA helicases, SNF2 family [Tessaracoccus bendigoensis DSM 12906]